jgi:hypothetical protein
LSSVSRLTVFPSWSRKLVVAIFVLRWGSDYFSIDLWWANDILVWFLWSKWAGTSWWSFTDGLCLSINFTSNIDILLNYL